MVVLDGIEWSASRYGSFISLGKGPVARVGQKALWNSKGGVEARDCVGYRT